MANPAKLMAAIENSPLDVQTIAQRVGVNVRTVRNWRNGVSVPRKASLVKLAEILGLSSVSELIDEVSGTPSNGAADPEGPSDIGLEAMMREAARLVQRVRRMKHRYKSAVVNWRIQRGLEKFRKVEAGDWSIEALNRYSHVREVFGHVLRFLRKSDRYHTLSCLSFWDEIGSESFVDYNVEAAHSGVEIDRVVLVNQSELSDPGQHGRITHLIGLLRDAHERSRDARGSCDAHFLITKDYEEEFGSRVPYAIISNSTNQDTLVVKSDVSTTPGLRFLFMTSQTPEYRRELDPFTRARHHAAGTSNEQDGLLDLDGIESQLAST
ncbi:MAG: helix-turn-helix transcriptional regulator [Myxococcota bacterium]